MEGLFDLRLDRRNLRGPLLGRRSGRPKARAVFFRDRTMDLFYWTLGAIIGGVAGSLINFSFEGVDFALTALFCVILTEQILASKDFLPPAIGIASSVAAAVLERVGILPQGNMLLLSLSVGITALALAKNLSKPKSAAGGSQAAAPAENGGKTQNASGQGGEK